MFALLNLLFVGVLAKLDVKVPIAYTPSLAESETFW